MACSSRDSQHDDIAALDRDLHAFFRARLSRGQRILPLLPRWIRWSGWAASSGRRRYFFRALGWCREYSA
jgi:hypothetical protein